MARLLEAINKDDDLYALWVASNVNAVDRLGMTDHGPVHVKIVMNLALQMLQLFVDREIEPSIVSDYGMTEEDGEIVVALAALMHDLGMSVHRKDHESFSLFLAREKLDALLPLVYDTRTARKAGHEIKSTGHALPEPNTFGPYPLNLKLEPGGATLEEMIASTEKGVLVSRFHYTNPVDPRRTVITGMTRFGTFLVENGKVTKAVRSMRFTDNVIEALSRVEAVGKELRRVDDVLAPALKLSSWRFTGATGE